MRLAWVLLVCGCSFEPGVLPGQLQDAARDDSGRLRDGDVDGRLPMIDAAPPRPIMFVQHQSSTGDAPDDVIFEDFDAAQDAGNFNVIVVSWTSTSSMVTGVTDTRGNTYTAATGITRSTQFSQQIWFAPNIVAGTNRVTATISASVNAPKIRIFEYEGIALAMPLDDVVTANGSGNVATTLTAGVDTTVPKALVFAAEVANANATGPGSGYTSRQLDDGDLVMDRIVSQTGSYSASVPLNNTGNWVLQVVAFKGQQ